MRDGVALDVLHHDQELVPFGDDVEGGDDVGMADGGGEPGFVEQHRDEVGIAPVLIVQALDRDGAREPCEPHEAPDMDGGHSTGRDGTGVVDFLLTLDARLDVRRYQPNDLIQAVERGEGDVAVVSPRLLIRLDKDYVTEAPPGEEEARRRRRAGFVIVRIVGRG